MNSRRRSRRSAGTCSKSSDGDESSSKATTTSPARSIILAKVKSSPNVAMPQNVPFLRRTLVPIRSKGPAVAETSDKEELVFTVVNLDVHGTPQCRAEAQRERKCPFCLFDTKTDKGLLKHCRRFHGDHHLFEAAISIDGILNILARPPKFRALHPNLVFDYRFVRIRCRRRKRMSDGPVATAKRRRMLPVTVAPNFLRMALPPSPPLARQYFHSRSRIPMNPEHMDMDSDDESDDEWLDELGHACLNEFVDVTEPEKLFLNLWKRFVRSDTMVADDVVPGKCLEFIRAYRKGLRGLRTQLLMHLIVLWEAKLVSSAHILSSMSLYDELHKDDDKLPPFSSNGDSRAKVSSP